MDLKKCSADWFAIQVRPRYEVRTARILCNKGYEQFVPLYRSKRQWSDRQKELELPLFTGYVFCRLNGTPLGPIITTPGVIRIVGMGKTMGMISNEEIDAIRKVVSHGFKTEPCTYLKKGDRVHIDDGPLAGLEGVVANYENGRHLILSIDLVHKSVAVDINACKITEIGDSPKPSVEQTVSMAGLREPPSNLAQAELLL